MTKILFNFLSLCDIQALSSNEILHFYCSHWYYNFNHVLSLREKLLKKDWNLEKRVFYPPIQLPFVKMQYWACSFARENLIMIRLLSGLSDYSSLHVNSIMCANALDVIITIFAYPIYRTLVNTITVQSTIIAPWWLTAAGTILAVKTNTNILPKDSFFPCLSAMIVLR